MISTQEFVTLYSPSEELYRRLQQALVNKDNESLLPELDMLKREHLQYHWYYEDKIYPEMWSDFFTFPNSRTVIHLTWIQNIHYTFGVECQTFITAPEDSNILLLASLLRSGLPVIKLKKNTDIRAHLLPDACLSSLFPSLYSDSPKLYAVK